MKYYSTNSQSPAVDFREACIQGQPPDKGLYFPERIPVADQQLISKINDYSNEEIALKIITPYIGTTIPKDRLRKIVTETVSFDIPLLAVNENMYSLELFHGPTLAFKDIGARFMSRCLGYFMETEKRKVTVLVATSGDTGGAVANGFEGVDGVEVVILYPSGKVSPVQEKQLTAAGKNIQALEVNGNFDDCQHMVKTAFSDQELQDKIFLTSANSINVARWLPQQFYYFFAYRQWADKSNEPVISVPSGNFGNLAAGLIAWSSGLPVRHFIAACNANDVIPRYFQSGKLQPKESIATLSNAMDVGNPSNWVRIMEIFKSRPGQMEEMLSAISITDEETVETIREVYNTHGYVLDPHGAVGYLALQRYIRDQPGAKGIFLETAHPVKFPAAVETIIGKPIEIPGIISSLMYKEKNSIKIEPRYPELKKILLERC